MVKRRTKKSAKKSSGGFFSSIFDFLTAIIVLGIVGGILYYWFFNGAKSTPGDKVKELYKDTKEIVSEKITPEKDVIDEKADEIEMDDIDNGIVEEEDIFEDDEMTSQFEDEITGNINDVKDDLPRFDKNINIYADKYKGLALKEGADPEQDRATDNSHLICSIIKHAADNSGKTFSGYMKMDEIRKNISKINRNDLRNGDLILLKNGMMGLVCHKNGDDFKLIYASQNKGSVLLTGMKSMEYYWLKPDNFKGYYRFNSSVLK